MKKRQGLTLAILAAVAWSNVVCAQSPANDFQQFIDEQNPRGAWLEFEYMDDNLDWLNFAEKASSTSTLKRDRIIHAGFRWQVGDDYAIAVSGFNRQVEITRVIEPTSLGGDQNGISLAVQRRLADRRSALQLKFNYFDIEPLTIHKYQLGNIVFGQDVILADPVTLEPFPIARFGMKESGLEAGYSRSLPRMSANYAWSLHYRFANIQPEVSSILFELTDPELLGATINGERVNQTIQRFRESLPQQSNWQEHIFSAAVSLDKPITTSWSTFWSMRAYGVARQNYVRGPNERQIRHNIVLSGYFSWSPRKHTAVHFGGKLYSNYLAGSHPGVYNRRISRLFRKPFGTLSIGLTYGF